MKKLLKVLFLGALTLGMAVGCDEKKPIDNPIKDSETNTSTDSGNTDSDSTNHDNTNDNGSGKDDNNHTDDDNNNHNNDDNNKPEKQFTGYTLATNNVKVNYIEGETLDLTNLKVYKNYSDSSKEEVTTYTVSPTNGTTLNEVGTVTVSVTIEGLETPLTFEVNVAKTPKTAWTDEEVTLMSTHLYGEVLPFTGLEESVVLYSETYGVVCIYGGKVGTDTLLLYSRALSSRGYILDSESDYKFKKTINTDKGERLLNIYFEQDEDGLFFLQAYSPYYYEFPTVFAETMALSLFDSTCTVPSFTADKYLVDKDVASIYCFVDSTTAEADYSQTLNDAGWDVEAEKDSAGFYVATSPDGRYSANYFYTESTKVFDISLMPSHKWSSTLIDSFFEKYDGPDVEIPTLDVDGLFLFAENSSNADCFEKGDLEHIHSTMIVYNTSEDNFNSYLAALNLAGWSLAGRNNSYTGRYEIENEGLVKLEAAYDSESGAIILTLYVNVYPFPDNYFPYKEIARNLGSDITERVPEYTGENGGYTLITIGDDYAFLVEVEEGKELEAKNAYIEQIKEEGYSLYQGLSTMYVSENGQILLQPRENTDGTFSVIYRACPTETWNTKRADRIIKELFNTNDMLPAYDGGWEYHTVIYEDDGDMTVSIYLEDDVSIDDAVLIYDGILEEAGFTFVGDSPEGKVYISPNKDYYVDAYNDDCYLTIYAFPLSSWPDFTIDSAFEERGFEDVLPEYYGERESISVEFGLDGYMAIIITCDDSATAASNYIDQLIEEEFTWVEDDDYNGVTYASPNNEFEARVSYFSTGFHIEIEYALNDIPEGNSFPMDIVKEAFADAEGLLPALEVDGATYEGEDGGDYIGIGVLFDTDEEVMSYYDSYVDALEEAGFVLTPIYGGTDEAYVKEGASFFVKITPYTDDNYRGVWMEIYDSYFLD